MATAIRPAVSKVASAHTSSPSTANSPADAIGETPSDIISCVLTAPLAAHDRNAPRMVPNRA